MQSVVLDPIHPGYAFSRAITFATHGDEVLGFSFLQASRVCGQFRTGPGAQYELIATLDSQNGSLFLLSADTVKAALSGNQTSLFPPGASAWLDFALLLGQEWFYLPALIPWPVVSTVTQPGDIEQP